MTQAASALGPTRRVPRWLLVALFASLAVNLVVVGLVAGALWRFRPLGWPGAAPNLLGYASLLPPERRKELWDQTAAERSRMRPLRREVRMAREATIRALTAQPYDRQLFLNAQQHQVEAEAQARRAVQELYLKIADGLTPEERHAFAHWRERHRPPGHNLLDVPEHRGKGAESDAAQR
jgi:uncharacterized membrane protein